MSEIRIADEVLLHRLHNKQGKKSIKYELFKSKQFCHHWTPLKRGAFVPSPPLNTVKRHEFWETMFRVRVNGKWKGDAKYSLFRRDEIIKMILEE